MRLQQKGKGCDFMLILLAALLTMVLGSIAIAVTADKEDDSQ
jgi:hypothetical protein